MNLIKINPSIKRALNEMLRTPQRQTSTRLRSGATAVISVYKNKQIVEVFCSIEKQFNSRI